MSYNATDTTQACGERSPHSHDVQFGRIPLKHSRDNSVDCLVASD